MLKYTQEDLQKMADFMSAEKAMLCYVRHSIVHSILIVFLWLAILGFGIFMTYGTDGVIWLALSTVVIIINSVFGIFRFFPLLIVDASVPLPFLDFFECKKMLKFLKSRKLYTEAVLDFSDAQSNLTDCIRLGKKYVFGKNHCVILRYTDISRVYQYVLKGRFMEIRRELHAVDNSGKVWHLCELGIVPELDLLGVLDFMVYKNPTIAIGYKSWFQS